MDWLNIQLTDTKTSSFTVQKKSNEEIVKLRIGLVRESKRGGKVGKKGLV